MPKLTVTLLIFLGCLIIPVIAGLIVMTILYLNDQPYENVRHYVSVVQYVIIGALCIIMIRRGLKKV